MEVLLLDNEGLMHTTLEFKLQKAGMVPVYINQADEVTDVIKGRDIAIAISSSGNSANIINGLAAANKHSMKTIALVGFNGGSVKENNLADTILHVNSNNYGVVEDTHMIILHALIQKLRKDRSAVSNPKL
mgnify:CR=1 FL=1